MREKLYKGLIYIGLGMILIFTPLARGAVRIWSITPVLLVIAFLVFIWLWKVNNTVPSYTKASEGRQRTRLDKLILIFIMLAAISFIFSIYKYASFYSLLVLLSYVGLYFLIVNNYSRRLRRYLIALVICVGTGLSVYGLLQYFGVLPHGWWIPNKFLAATYVNHNHFAGYLELVIPVTLGALIHYKSMSATKRLALTEALVIMAAAFIFSQSRGGWVSLGISLFIMNVTLVNKKILKARSVFILLLIVIAVFSAAYFKEGLVSKRIETLTELPQGEASFGTRVKIWKETAGMIAEHPFVGTGIGTFVWAFPKYRPAEISALRAHYAHNDYLQMTAEMGIFALPLMLLMLWIVIRRGLGRYEGRKDINILKIGCAIGILSLSLHGFVDFNFHIPANMILVTVYAAIVMCETDLP